MNLFRVVYVSADRQIRVIGPDGRDSAVTSADDGLLWASWAGASKAARGAHTWPAFNPAGDRIACFRMRGPDDAVVLVSDLDGVSSAEVIELPSQLPIYLQWSADGERLAVVSQAKEDLLLTVGRTDAVGAQRILAKGSPLFVTWTPDGRLATFIGGGSSNARMMLLDPDMRGPTEVLPGTPGDFCAPVVAGNTVLYGVHTGGSAQIVQFAGSSAPRVLPGGEGLLAFVASPDGRFLARAVAAGGEDGTPYTGLTVIDLESGQERRISDMTCLAFFWTPDARALVVARNEADRGVLEWFLVDVHGTARHLVDLVPTRDLSFYLRFFEQYTSSHPIVDPSSSWLLLPGVLRGSAKGARLWRVPLRGGQPEDLAEGQFGAFSPLISH